MIAVLATTLQLAADDPALDPTSGRGPEWGKAAPVALVIILLLGIALFVLIRSMNTQLRKVPSDFMRGETGSGTEPAPTAPPAPSAPTAPAAPTVEPSGETTTGESGTTRT